MSAYSADELRSLLQAEEDGAFAEAKTWNPHKAEKIRRRALEKWLEGFTAEYRLMLGSDVSLTEEGQEERIIHAVNDFDFFCETYFPHHLERSEPCALHTHLSGIAHEIVDDAIGRNYAIAAPRGHAKTTRAVLTCLWLIVRKNLPKKIAQKMRGGIKHYIAYVSDAVELAEVNGETIKAELTDNANLAFDFPHACGVGMKWSVGEFITKNRVKFKTFGSNKAIRGHNFFTKRVDFVIIDDYENDIQVRSRAQRDKGEDIIDDAVLNLGDISGGLDVLYIGTVLHPDSILARKLRDRSWFVRHFKALERFPSRMGLWDHYAEILRDSGLVSAQAYYHRNQAEMDEGALRLWGAKPLEQLMRMHYLKPRTFAKEMQNDPRLAGAKFSQELLDRIFRPASLAPKAFEKIILSIDMAGDGKCGQGVVIAGITREGGSSAGSARKKVSILYSREYNLSDAKIIAELIRLCGLYGVDDVVGDKNGGWGIILSWFQEKATEKGLNVRTKAIHHRMDKMDRIGDTEMQMENGHVEVFGEQPILRKQYEEFGEGDSVDVIDAAEMAITHGLGNRKKGTMTRPRKNLLKRNKA